MKYFTCLVPLDGRSISEAARSPYENVARRRSLECEWWSRPSVTVLSASDKYGGSATIAEYGAWVAVGSVRLDNRPEVMSWADGECPNVTDLEVVLRVIAAHGARYVARFLGDFGFVACERVAHTLIAASDAFAVQRIYYAERDGIIALSSRADALALDEEYDPEYLASLLALKGRHRHLSVYAGVRQLPGGSVGMLVQGRLRVTCFWDPAQFEVEQDWLHSEQDAVELCRNLLSTAVCLRVDEGRPSWAQLSGGLDSSSVVSLTEWLAANNRIAGGLAGTVTHVDRQVTGADERVYSDAVVADWRIRNELILDPPTWHDPASGNIDNPLPDQPTFQFPFSPRDQRLAEIVLGAGGRVLLTGWGGDELFTGNMFFFADQIVQGRLVPAFTQMAHCAAIGRSSLWELAYRNALLPLLPRPVQALLVTDGASLPPWLHPKTLRRYRLKARSPMAVEYGGPLGRKYWYAVTTRVRTMSTLTEDGVLNQRLDVRHPFMYRPLVEFALRLPPSLRARPHAHRWILREAMKGILSEVVRLRVGKQDTGEALAWSLASERAYLSDLVEEPILGSLGLIDPQRLRESFDRAFEMTGSGECLHAQLTSTLAVEAWLRARCGGWSRGGHKRSSKVNAESLALKRG